ncbi:hypothetical protein Pmani_004329 [Petrolisthes manimaculis]|uniref:Secreted protein n=1 Tax=Petrolisthes manimaculis TaxID=1843537 RepID=A0AAE1UNE1_9EUCA|nr:hypothetical protein Pmani_004329 [Petrolisthes manimaculis]
MSAIIVVCLQICHLLNVVFCVERHVFCVERHVFCVERHVFCVERRVFCVERHVFLIHLRHGLENELSCGDDAYTVTTSYLRISNFPSRPHNSLGFRKTTRLS